MSGALARAELAQRRVEATHEALVRSAAPWRASLRRHPATWLLGSGFVAGLVAGLLPVHRLAQTGFYVASTGVRLLMPFLAGIEAHSERTSSDQ